MTSENIKENKHFISDTSFYGSTIQQSLPFTNSNEETFSDHDWSSEEFCSVKLAKRKKKRLQKHHQTQSPQLVSKLSHIVKSATQSEEEEENKDDVIQIPPDDLVLPELDPNAAEVSEYVPLIKPLDHRLRKQINLSTIRERYRETRLKRNSDQPLTKSEKIKKKWKYYTNMSKAKQFLFGNTSILLFVYTDLMVDLILCISYLVEMKQEENIVSEPFWLYKWRSYELWSLCVFLSVWNFASFIMRIFLTGRLVNVMFSFRSFIELLTTYPFLASVFMKSGQFLYVPYFLRSWVLLLRIKSVMKIKINLLMADKPVDALKSKLIHLVGTLVVLLYNGLSAFQYCEVTFGNVNYSILDSLYVVMVTLSTVGYGDITPRTEGSRVVMMLLIVISLAVLPSLIADALNTLRKRNEWGGCVSDSSKPFILIIGTFHQEQVIEILDGFLNTENTEPHLNVVFLDINKPNQELKFLERNSMWGHRIQFIHGSDLDEQTLKRVQARSASAIFTLSDQHALDPHKEDERNTVRLWSLYCHTVVHNVDIYTYNLSPSTSIYQKMAKEIICVREFKQHLLAMNCRCRGVSTLLTNLLHQRQHMDHYDESWQAQYDDGSCNEIYMDKPPYALVGLSFKEAAWIVYTECQVILFGIKSYYEDSEHREMLLNPENNYIIKANDLCIYMCESPREVNDINNMNMRYVREKVNAIKQSRLAENGKTPQKMTSMTSIRSELKASLIHASQSTPITPLNENGRSRPSSLRRISSMESNQTMASPPIQHFQLARLPTPRMALLKPTDDPSRDIKASPVCYLLDDPETLKEMTIESADHLSGHILVCMHRKVSNIYKFILNLRSPQLKPNELQHIVFLCTSLPTEKTFDSLSRFPKVSFMRGDCQRPEDLIKAGVKRAKQVVVMSERECLDQNQRTSDSPAIMTSHLLDLLLQDKAYDSPHIVNLVEKSNIRFMHLLQGKDVAEEIDVFYTPAYAAGNVVVDSLLSNVLLSQAYYKPDIVSVIKALCGLSGPLYDKDTAHMLMCGTKFHPHLFKKSRHLMLISLPHFFIDKSFSVLFECLILDHEVVTLGLLRAPDENMGNELSFVYTNPVPSLILKRTDKIYVLASQGWSFLN
ncbi:unnamed protein product [Rhizopus stolonifer]